MNFKIRRTLARPIAIRKIELSEFGNRLEAIGCNLALRQKFENHRVAAIDENLRDLVFGDDSGAE